MKFKQILIALILGFGLILSLGILGPISIVRAAGIAVNTTNDGLNDGDGQCSLREAIEAANTDAAVDDCPAGSGNDTITLIAGTYVLTHAGGDLDITSTLTIEGNGATINGNATDRVFDITDTAAVTISNVIIQNGSGVNFGGGIFNQGTLTLNQSTVTSNTANFDGGGIHNRDGTLTVNNSTISKNLAKGQGFGDDGVGGGIANSAESADATLTVSQSSIISNTVDGVGGGGISNSSKDGNTATVTVADSIIRNNTANGTDANTGFGGGIRNGFFSSASSSSSSILTVSNSTISGNSAINGGGIGSGTTLPTSGLTLQATVTSSTVSSNTVAGGNNSLGNGGGLVNQNSTMTVVNSTISGNEANGTGAPNSGLGGGLINSRTNLATTLWLTNTTISSNTAATNGDGLANVNLGASPTANFKNSILAGGCSNSGGTLNSNGHNLEDGNTCNLTATGDITNTNPLLGSLQNNGGDTDTHALLANSPAIDAADTAVCAAAPVNGVDQRGVARGTSECSIGAYEGSAAGVYLPIVLKSSS